MVRGQVQRSGSPLTQVGQRSGTAVLQYLAPKTRRQRCCGWFLPVFQLQVVFTLESRGPVEVRVRRELRYEELNFSFRGTICWKAGNRWSRREGVKAIFSNYKREKREREKIRNMVSQRRRDAPNNVSQGMDSIKLKLVEG